MSYGADKQVIDTRTDTHRDAGNENTRGPNGLKRNDIHSKKRNQIMKERLWSYWSLTK